MFYPLHEDNLHYSIFLLLDQHSKTVAVVFDGHGLSVLVTIDISYYKRDFFYGKSSQEHFDKKQYWQDRTSTLTWIFSKTESVTRPQSVIHRLEDLFLALIWITGKKMKG